MKKLAILVLVTLLLSTQLFAEDWMQLYPEIDGPVADMEFSALPGISEYGLIFAIADSGGGLGYFDSPGNFSIFSIATNLGAVSVASDNTNNRIFCAFGCGSYSDGLYEFDVATHQFEFIEWIYNPNFVKKLSSGFYFGWDNGLLYSTDGNIWTDVYYFNDKDVRDVVEINDGTLFVATGNEVYIENDTTFFSYNTGLPVNDIYIRHHPTEEVYIAIGDGSWSDGIYKVEYEDGEITEVSLINWAVYPNKIYEYEDWLVVGCLNSEGLWLVEPIEMGEMYQIGTGLDFEDVYCFETYPMYCPNIMVGMDTGIYLGTDFLTTLPVYISVFEAYWNYSDDVAIIHWRTESETDVLGFNLYRNDEDDITTAVQVNIDLIPGHGTTTEPHDYYYEDDGIEPYPMDEYYYWLEVLDFGGMTHIYGPTHLVIPNCVLSTFTAQYLNNIPTLYWVTESETDNMGWFIYRNTTEDFTSSDKISGMIDGHGTTTQPQDYIYEDAEELQVEQTYYYWLESIDFAGESYIYYPSVHLTIPASVEESPIIYNTLTLHQNFPNPFKTSTQISFSLPHPENIKIQIYNLKGQLIQTLLDENKQAGIHILEWNAENSSSGIYFIKLSTKEVSKIQKVILIK